MNNSLENKIPVISIVGPTASGKTRLGVVMAKHFDGEVISADSMQIYEKMDIATAKPSPEEMCGIPHHLIGFLPSSESFSVAQFTELAAKKIQEISQRGKMPVIVGGTGLYVDSLLNNISFCENDTDKQLRAELWEKAEKYGVMSLADELRSFDPDSADRIEPNNVKRVIRAIEVYRTTGITMTEQNRRSRMNASPYMAVKIGLKAADRQFLYQRINKRVDIMAENGLLEEAETAKKAIGYKELVPYFEGKASLNEVLDELKKQSRRYAKRQLTWFLRDKEIHWFNIDEFENCQQLDECAAAYAESALKKMKYNIS